MAAMKRSLAVDIFWKIHPIVYRLSGGRLLGKLTGMPVLLLTTLGRKSGQARMTPLTYLPGRDDFVVIGSFLGEPRHPGWVHNLRAEPRARIQVGRTFHEVVAYEAEGEEREQLWAAAGALGAGYEEYDERVERVIPVVVLRPV
jgi:deazaflavin-dependent oxidoreductase (nitroreductase family)